jgi:hypothetical protein
MSRLICLGPSSLGRAIFTWNAVSFMQAWKAVTGANAVLGKGHIAIADRHWRLVEICAPVRQGMADCCYFNLAQRWRIRVPITKSTTQAPHSYSYLCVGNGVSVLLKCFSWLYSSIPTTVFAVGLCFCIPGCGVSAIQRIRVLKFISRIKTLLSCPSFPVGK